MQVVGVEVLNESFARTAHCSVHVGQRSSLQLRDSSRTEKCSVSGTFTVIYLHNYNCSSPRAPLNILKLQL